MNLVAVFDLIALAGFAGALLIALLTARGGEYISRLAATLIMFAMLIMAFVSLLNLLESSGIFGGMDGVEDYVEVLLFPLIGYALYVIYSSDQIAYLRAAVNAMRAEHALLVNIMDGSLVGIVLVDDVGCVTFANRFASDVLGVSECGEVHACSSDVHIVPVGESAPELGVFHDSVQDRRIEGELWDLLGPEGRAPIKVTASPLEESGRRQGGSVVVLLPVPETLPVPGA